MTSPYVISSLAEQDIEEIITYIALDSVEAAYSFVDALYDAFDNLVDNPLIGHKREDLTKYPVLFWTFKWHYLIVYLPEDPLKIIRVLSGQRDVSKIIT